MARNQVSKSSRKADPLKTKNGRTRLGPLSIAKLQEMAEKSNRPRDKDKILRAINYRSK
jgi:hypothetical protein